MKKWAFKTKILDYVILFKANGTEVWDLFHTNKRISKAREYFKENALQGYQYQFCQRRKIVGEGLQIFLDPMYEVAR